MIYTVTPAGRAARWTGANHAEIEAVCDGRTVRAHLFDETGIAVDAWGDPQLVALGDWVVNRKGALTVLGQRQFLARYRITVRPTTTKKAAAA